VGGTDAAVVWYHLIGPNVDQWLPSTPALIAELERHAVRLADLREVGASGKTTDMAA
jgi:hypothetical protein